VGTAWTGMLALEGAAVAGSGAMAATGAATGAATLSLGVICAPIAIGAVLAYGVWYMRSNKLEEKKK